MTGVTGLTRTIMCAIAAGNRRASLGCWRGSDKGCLDSEKDVAHAGESRNCDLKRLGLTLI
jgi:hypothetical protein